MLLRIFACALLFVIVTAPIAVAVGKVLIRYHNECRIKTLGQILEFIGKELKKHKEDQNDQSESV